MVNSSQSYYNVTTDLNTIACLLFDRYVYPKVVSAYSKPSAPEQAAVEEEQK